MFTTKTFFITLAAIASMANAQNIPSAAPVVTFPPNNASPVGQAERGFTFKQPTTAETTLPPGAEACHTCSCFTCAGATDNGDGTIDITIEHCKGSSVSWMCCVGVDGQEGNCNVIAPCTSAKCSSIPEKAAGGGLVIQIPDSSTSFTINTHDGLTSGTGDLITSVCGGNKNQGTGCEAEDYSAHCVIDFDVEADCSFTPTTTTTCDTTETFACEDGSTVTRSLPDCEFADCPTPDSDPTDAATVNAFTRGDPHFKTFGNELYDYHGECDLVLLKNPLFENMGMEIHIRTKITDWWSAVEAAAVKIGDEVLEVNAGSLEKWLVVNGKPNEEMEDKKFYHLWMSGFEVRYRRSGVVREAYVYLNGRKERLAFKTYKGFLRVDVDWQANPAHYKGALGLLGSMDLDGDRVGRDGKTHIGNHNEFGQEWQVREDEHKLFHSYEDAVVAPQQCKLPDFSPEKMAEKQRRLAESKLTTEEIEKACSHLPEDERKSCEYDVIATQDLGMAAVW